ncbi:hypothetical protein R70723_16660 [Paenibacillus sp. FSL R7-0273]|uniref:TetR/AcrR family transcriptional regulator n=1 Tax=Paenibacillus sp. FSL R7-0273 TaxID=1536772 RepID=UPI0004F65DFF|nr:TetR/AcrR family transcriptional regulator [Paenibacillus sp. FSL R7-0273]AIQ47337.1 hypothetical protein R70723_16660 [Paenibacillus sp. FSL R7-0273]OMF96109.1 hypothetical protein BK144_05920 [Paenibacillus sp. FSL R7-0273]
MNMKQHREARNKKEILEATVALLETSSYSSLTVESVAAQAGVGKATIYRWWNSKAQLVLDAFLMTVESEFDFDPGKPLKDNFKQQLGALARILGSSIGKSTLTIVTENEEIAGAFYHSFLIIKRNEARQVLQTAIDNGEVQSGIAMDIVLDLLYGPLYFQILIYKKLPDEAYIDNLLNHVMQGITISN